LQLSKRIQVSVKLIITLAAFAFIAWKLIRFDDLKGASQLFMEQLQEAPISLLLIAVALIPVNWWFELKKWRQLILPLHPIQWPETIRAVISGLTMALMTPNRVGEVFSRVYILPREKRLAGVGLSAIGSLAHMVVIQAMGILGIALLFTNPDFLLDTGIQIGGLAITVGGLVCTAIVFLYFKIDRVLPWLKRIKAVAKHYPSFEVLATLSFTVKWQVLGWSLLKYFTYTTQFYCLLRYFGVDLPWHLAYPAMMSVYILLNYLPMISIGELGIRGSVTLLIIGQLSSHDLGILAGSMSLWIINIMFPAIVGAFFMPKVKF